LRTRFPAPFLQPMTTKRAITLLVGVAAWACNADTTQPRPPSDLVVSGGDAQSWYFDNPLPVPLSVIAVDPGGEPVAGVVVTWSVAQGDGAVSPAQSTTNANGVASTIDSIGSSTLQRVSASFPGLANAAAFTEVGSAPPTTAAVDVRDDNFNPQNVVVQTSGTVTWTRSGVNHHNVTFGSGPAIPTKIFEADLETGTVASRTRTFTALGTYSYSCTNHPPNMKGTVTVVH